MENEPKLNLDKNKLEPERLSKLAALRMKLKKLFGLRDPNAQPEIDETLKEIHNLTKNNKE